MRRRLSVVGVFLLAGAVGGFCGSCFAQSPDSEFPLGESAGASGPASISVISTTSTTSAISTTAQPGQAVPTRKKGGDSSNRYAIGVKVSTLGIGGEFAVRVSHRINVRAGGNYMSLSHTFTDNGITYGGQLHFRSAEAHLDWFFLGPLHLSPGALLYNGNNVTATVAVPAGSTFSLNSTNYESSSAVPVGGNASLKLNKVAPSILLGIGNMIPRSGRHFGAHFEIGGIYEGSPNIALGLTGTACTPPNTAGGTCQDIASSSSIQTNLAGEQSKVNHDAAPYKFYPVVSMGFSIAF